MLSKKHSVLYVTHSVSQGRYQTKTKNYALSDQKTVRPNWDSGQIDKTVKLAVMSLSHPSRLSVLLQVNFEKNILYLLIKLKRCFYVFTFITIYFPCMLFMRLALSLVSGGRLAESEPEYVTLTSESVVSVSCYQDYR